jgi:hypothetical protein
MDYVALDRPWSDDGDGDDDILKFLRFEAGEQLLLGAGFHLKRADGVAPLEGVVDRRVVQRK